MSKMETIARLPWPPDIEGAADPMMTCLRKTRAVEDIALNQWSAAVANVEHAVERRDCALARATAVIHRRMAPLTPARYVRLEQTVAGTAGCHRSRDWMRDTLHVQRTRQTVDESRARLAEIIEAEDAQLTAAREARSAATAELIRAAGLDRTALVTGLSPQRLGMMRARR